MRRGNILYAPYGFKPATILVKEGDRVTAGDPICTIMGMEESITTPVNGRITKIHIKLNQAVSWDRALVTIEREAEAVGSACHR
ncbi:hypothetical protein A2810_00415 [candidate division Kazan bacterium RIFCSPHIGHO2_01_FULL_49_10]|uniref:Lipoyl-binding domain-containing protein n=1 Tax=candidate division Kazan bacterium RIFCSPLOWO2_01_FULL_48_13 TaxID=1798539 RepID=A0A1F4PPG0_UNCK3|nr:MAG: hypothetical protein A2810_00415 [candidate division Kazan bacterium RIFCSPHIGHO2_01_FULL_49_10]OGB85561.1 MAG: hypothetical protein A2994_00865 [candidate division Kazan bacterium RIFCSPLOWO2_01_FULL_48_13]